MEAYQTTVDNVLTNGTYRPNRTGVDTISTASQQYTVDLRDGFPLLTTKQMDTFRWNSMLHELMWYLSGEHHIRNLQDHTSVWNAWADDNGNLPSAYGRYWRRFPVPTDDAHLPGEAWADTDCPWVSEDPDTGTLVFDQFAYVVDTLNGDNPHRDKWSRRLKITAWHPANAGVSDLPPCHCDYLFNVQGDDTLHLLLFQRSADLALGVPFNLAAYSILLQAVAQYTDLTPATLTHVLGDAHIYCGQGARGEWYANHLDDLQSRLAAVDDRPLLQQAVDLLRGRSQAAATAAEYRAIREWLLAELPAEETDTNPDTHEYGYDHVPGLLEQLAREPYARPTLTIADKPPSDLTAADVTLTDYTSHGGLQFKVAE